MVMRRAGGEWKLTGVFFLLLIISGEAVSVHRKIEGARITDNLVSGRGRSRKNGKQEQAAAAVEESTSLARRAAELVASGDGEAVGALTLLETSTAAAATGRQHHHLVFTITVLAIAAALSIAKLVVSVMRWMQAAKARKEIEVVQERIMSDQSTNCIMARQLKFQNRLVAMSFIMDVESRKAVVEQQLQPMLGDVEPSKLGAKLQKVWMLRETARRVVDSVTVISNGVMALFDKMAEMGCHR